MSAKASGGTGIRNIIILAVVGIGGYFLYKKLSAATKLEPEAVRAPKATGPAKPIVTAGPATNVIPPPDRSGPAVKKGQLCATRSNVCVTKKEKDMRYFKIISVDAKGYKNFKPTINGRFTRRLLCVGKNKWAEVLPA